MTSLDTTFAALADPTRRAILAQLCLGESNLSALAGPVPMSLPALMKHVDSLERAGLLTTRKEGRVRRCRLLAAPLAEAADWIGHYREFWEKRFDALERYLAEGDDKEKDRWPKRTFPPPSRSAPRARSRPRAKGSSVPGPRRKP
ncbi:MAG TPA: metalloregulator ArsR/SmtB family transcription factor [Vicinamibacteria bacterium]